MSLLINGVIRDAIDTELARAGIPQPDEYHEGLLDLIGKTYTYHTQAKALDAIAFFGGHRIESANGWHRWLVDGSFDKPIIIRWPEEAES